MTRDDFSALTANQRAVLSYGGAAVVFAFVLYLIAHL
jgi:hypothetical protein